MSSAISPIQLRMARAALKVTLRELESRIGVNKDTIVRIEAGKEVLASAFQRLEKFYRDAGIVFVEPDRKGLAGVLCPAEGLDRVLKKRSQNSR